MTVWYRYEARHYAPPLDEYDEPCGEGHRELVLMELPVLRETRCGVRLTDGRFVLKQSRKRYACPTKEEAMESFKRRKAVQISILQAQLRSAERDLALTGKESRTEKWADVEVSWR